MAEEFYTVAQAAERLQLHAKTVLRFIREGRLPATRIGKSYRLKAGDVAVFAGSESAESLTPEPIRATCIVEVPALSSSRAERLITLLQATLLGRRGGSEPIQCQTAHDVSRSLLKIVLIAAPADAAALLSLIQTLADDCQ
ncbi:helix-turn-helix domain-containing protein [Pseudomonas vanderleydeniana]|uniref:Helix-turn-helix domain-containing protein n=1 Tax=Pseudomonas vanderleydeniana TaxID=2745495 RepID=A0A9E6TTJ4_9PSED|nr:helix-turn-helix domain-containing protein [Pseudomonas vanderleydeniana]QXI30748.1 helix-turn-helix domain-containing protein [Pseudomonas vanderleydeniana]